MTLSDRETLELNQLCDAVVEGTLASAERLRLEELLRASEDTRRYYIRALDLSASLGHYAGEMQMEAADRTTRGSAFGELRSVRWAAMAAAVAFLLTWWLTRGPSNPTHAVRPEHSEYVARISGAKDVIWPAAADALIPGAFLRRGQRLELNGGFAEVTFDSGAVVLIEGPAVMDITSAWNARLRRGAMKAHVPPQALGFSVSNRSVEVVDIGTEFSMVSDEDGGADVLVLQGEVEAMLRGHEDAETILMQANDSRRFERSGVSEPENSDQMRARFSNNVVLDRLIAPADYVRWSFDELLNKSFPAKYAGFLEGDYRLKLLSPSPTARKQAHVAGIHDRAIRFDGQLAARAVFPGISGSFPRTVAFWVKVPENAPLSRAYSMVAWRGDPGLLAARPVHIGWNRHPTEGPLGAIRTDFSGGHAMGMTPLRDGQWHHVAVIFLLNEGSPEPVQVKQYVDGRLESNIVTPGPKRSVGGNVYASDSSSTGDRLWVGTRLGASGPKKERFLGEIDDLIVINRGLEPAEIVALMDGHVDSPAAGASP